MNKIFLMLFLFLIGCARVNFRCTFAGSVFTSREGGIWDVPVPNAEVEISSRGPEEAPVLKVTTDTQGNYSGTYTWEWIGVVFVPADDSIWVDIRVSAPGYKTYVMEWTLFANKHNEISPICIEKAQ